MVHHAEILSAQTEQRRAVEFRIAAHIIVGVRMQLFAIGIKPMLFGLVLAFYVHQLCVPIRLFARNKVAALKYQDLLSGRSETMGQRSSTGSASNDDHVVMIDATHALFLSFRKKCSRVWGCDRACSNALPRGLCATRRFPPPQAWRREAPGDK